jgi:hypothetical protein
LYRQRQLVLTKIDVERLKTKLSIVVFSGWGAAICFGQTLPLDAPGEKKVTVGSEIHRGVEEMDNAARASTAVDLHEFAEEIYSKVITRNTAANTDSDGFMIGVRFVELLQLYARLDIADVRTFNGEAKVTEAAKLAKFCHAELRRLQKKIGVDDDALMKAAQPPSAEKETRMRAILTAYDSKPSKP